MNLKQNTETVTVVTDYALELSPEELAMLYVILGNVCDGVCYLGLRKTYDFHATAMGKPVYPNPLPDADDTI